jgi:hypothetical protein
MPFSGGTPTPLPLGAEATTIVSPSALPDGSMVYCQCLQSEARGIYLATPGAPPRQILPDVSPVQYAPSPDPGLGYVLFLRGTNVVTDPGTLMAQAIHPRQLRLLGDPVAIADGVRGFSASNTGVLVYSEDATFVGTGAPGIVRGHLTWFDREGRVVGTVGEPGIYRALALSPDQDLLAVERGDPTQNIDVYLLEFARGVSNRFTFDAANDFQPVWSPDGSSVIFSRFERGVGAWYRRAADLADDEELLFRTRDPGAVSSISPDGRFLLFTGPLPGPGDIQAVDLERVPEAREAIPIVNTQFFEVNARFSPDGRWIAYASNDSGEFEVYVRPFNPDAQPGESPAAGGRVMVSKGGGTGAGAIWRADGEELFYISTDGMMTAVPVSTAVTFSVSGPPRPLFRLPTTTVFFDVSRDGQRFLIPVPEGAGTSVPPYKVVLNWTSTLN